MESGAKTNLETAKKYYKQNIAMMEQRCPCGKCKEEVVFDADLFCYVVLFETIVTLSQALAGMIVGEVCKTGHRLCKS
jgi:hypothetical protein